MSEKRVTSISGQIVFVTLVLMMASAGWAQNYDVVMDDAPDVTSTNSADWKSPDLKIGSDFNETFPPDIIRRGVSNPIYAKFYFNGLLDHDGSSGIQIMFHYRNASIGDTPPPFDPLDPSYDWIYIADLTVDYGPSPPPVFFTKTWPEDFLSVTNKFVNWTPLEIGDYYHIRAEVIYPVDENTGDNVAISLYESILGIRDVDLVIVHDVSGSMLSYQYAGSPYIDHAKARVIPLVLNMDNTHKLAVVAFSDCLAGGVTDIWPIPASLQDANLPNRLAAVSAISTNVTVPHMGCMTTMGVGLQRAIQILTAVSPDPARKRAILLLSDGYENWGTPRACPPSHPTGTCIGGSILAQLKANNIRVFSVALGPAAWSDCLECLAVQSEGKWYSSYNPGIDLLEVYLDMQQVYSADDLYRVDRGISGGGDDVYSTYFEGVDDVLYFVLGWDDLNAELDLQLGPPGGSWSPPEKVPNASVHRGKGYVVVRVGEPVIGTWGYRVIGEDGKDYLVAVRSNRVGVRLEMDVKSEGIVGGYVEIYAHLADGMEPVTDANVAATIQVPVEASLETILRDASRDYMLIYGRPPVEPAELDRNPDISPRGLFIQKIMGDRQEPLVMTRSVNVPLEHTGNGFYSGVLDRATTTAGVYRVTVRCSEGRFDRNYSRELRLDPGNIDYEESYAELFMLRQTGGESLYLLRVCPVDRFGNAITDPSLLERVTAEVTGVEPSRRPEIVFGSYQQELRGDPDIEPIPVTVTIDDRKVKIR